MSMRQPPKFATDPWCWDYTVEKVNGNHHRKHGTTLDYEDWQARHFMAANKIYAAVVNKYGEGREAAGGIECPRCEQVKPFPEGDYICEDCRFGTGEVEEPEPVTAAQVSEAAPESDADLFDRLSSALNGSNVPAPAPTSTVRQQASAVATISSPARSDSGRIRNIGAMSDAKLVKLNGEMVGYSDPEAQDRITNELAARGL